jgi:hypothetical protein
MIYTMTERAFKLMAAAPISGCLVEFGVYQRGGQITMAQVWYCQSAACAP